VPDTVILIVHKLAITARRLVTTQTISNPHHHLLHRRLRLNSNNISTMLAINRTQAISGPHPPINPSIGEMKKSEKKKMSTTNEKATDSNINP
jgi:hypothetical protein